ncbi:MAG: hypothetical protein U0Q12_11110 [Vicinamibacterales bacterium]
MGGAFVAVADDATATVWNPAGLASGDFLGVTAEGGQSYPPTGLESAGGTTSVPMFVGVATPPLGVSFVRRPVVGVSADRSTGPTFLPRWTVARVQTTAVGLTVLQSVNDYVVVGGTVRFGRQGVDAVNGRAPLVGDGPSSGVTDADLGVLVRFAHVRAGATFWNLRRPTFDDVRIGRVAVPRAARVGVAFQPTDDWTVAVDADLTRLATFDGDRRMLAAGVERWSTGRRVGVRAGIRSSLLGDYRPAGSLGASLAVRHGAWMEGQFTRGTDRADHSWGIGLRVGF